MVEWWKNIVDFLNKWENPSLQKPCLCSATGKCHLYILVYNVDIERHYINRITRNNEISNLFIMNHLIRLAQSMVDKGPILYRAYILYIVTTCDRIDFV